MLYISQTVKSDADQQYPQELHTVLQYHIFRCNSSMPMFYLSRASESLERKKINQLRFKLPVTFLMSLIRTLSFKVYHGTSMLCWNEVVSLLVSRLLKRINMSIILEVFKLKLIASRAHDLVSVKRHVFSNARAS